MTYGVGRREMVLSISHKPGMEFNVQGGEDHGLALCDICPKS